MKAALLYPFTNANFSFADISIANGIKLVYLGDSSIWKYDKKLYDPKSPQLAVYKIWQDRKIALEPSHYNVGLLLVIDEIDKLGYGNIEDNLLYLIPEYLFLKTRKSFDLSKVCYGVKVTNREHKLTSIDPKNIYHADHINIRHHDLALSVVDLEHIRDCVHLLPKYYRAESSRTVQNKPSPISRALDIFWAAWGYDITDGPKLLLTTAALESLFSIGSAEIQFRLAHNISHFLHPDCPEQRKTVFNLVKTFYRDRSTLIHGRDNGEIAYFGPCDQPLEITCLILTRIIEDDNLFEIFNNISKHEKYLAELEYY